MSQLKIVDPKKYKKLKWSYRAKKDIKVNIAVYLMILPTVVYFFIFNYIPMYGAQIAFRDFTIGGGIWGSEWVGLKHFMRFFESYYFLRLVRNTLLISFYDVLFGFPSPIILALLLNEVRNMSFKRATQTITYMPYFISMVVICGMLTDFSVTSGLFNQIRKLFGLKPTPFLSYPQYFRAIYIGSNIWQQVGWSSIIYLAALSNIDPQLYEAAKIDGAGRFRQTFAITLPSIAPTIIILLILRLGRLMNVGHEKILLLYNPATYEVADVISTFVYRQGLIKADFSYSTAIGLFNSLINFMLLVSVNAISRKVTETSLW